MSPPIQLAGNFSSPPGDGPPPEPGFRRGGAAPLAVFAVVLLAAAVLAVWNIFWPIGFARTYGRLFGDPLVVGGLELTHGRQTAVLRPGDFLDVNPAEPLRLTKLNTNRFRNYDLRLFSPDLNLEAVTARASTLEEIRGEDYFAEPRELRVEVLEEAKILATFTLRAAFTALDWSVRGDAAQEQDRKIRYYRLALDLDPVSEVLAGKLSASLAAAGRRAELAELMESELARAADADDINARLLGLLSLYQDMGLKDKQIAVIERLVPLAETAGRPLEGLKTSLAALHRDENPLEAAKIYEELVPGSEPDHQRAYLSELVNIYRAGGLEGREIAAWERLLELSGPEEAPGVWSQLLALRERAADGPGQREAWEGLAKSLPDGREKADAYQRLAYLWYAEGDLDKAEEAYREALRHDRTDAALLLNLARLALAKNDRAGYKDNLEKSLALRPDPALTRELALARVQDGEEKLALPLFLTLAEGEAATPEALEIRRDARARTLEILRPDDGGADPEYERRLFQFSDRAVEFYNLGVAHFQAKDWVGAVRAFLMTLELSPEKALAADARAYLIAAYRETGQTVEMINQAMSLYRDVPSGKESRDLVVGYLETEKNWTALAKAAGLWTVWQPDDPDNWRYLALAQGGLGETGPSARSLLRAAELAPGQTSGWLSAAEALEKSGDDDAAKQAYQKVMELEPDNARAESALLRLALEALTQRREPG